MARKLRLEEAGGLYHVINRGNYRQPVFGSVGAAQAFETTLRETVERFGWRVHAYVLMTNHYHLALETPQPNLVDGMHWLQSTFATRFNRFRAERGHLFQGRYQALPIEDVAALARVVDYIHLNPVRAGLVGAEQLAGFRWSSLRKFLRGERWSGLTGERVMPFRGLADETAGWAEDEARLRALAGDEAEQKRRGFDELSKGWAIGTAGWRSALAKELAQKDLAGMSREEARGLREDRWRAELATGLAKRGKAPADLAALKPRQRGEPWRYELAAQLRRAGAPHGWIAQTLGYPSTDSLRVRLNAKA
ncbi:MAG TPA: transposase [Opitutaceae bacterium]|nr:transposase [Opitutaceae bacterium]